MAGEALVAIIGGLLAAILAATYGNTHGWWLLAFGAAGAFVAVGMLDGWRGHN